MCAQRAPKPPHPSQMSQAVPDVRAGGGQRCRTLKIWRKLAKQEGFRGVGWFNLLPLLNPLFSFFLSSSPLSLFPFFLVRGAAAPLPPPPAYAPGVWGMPPGNFLLNNAKCCKLGHFIIFVRPLEWGPWPLWPRPWSRLW